MDLHKIHKERALKTRHSTLGIENMVYGKVPPQAKDLEQVILGAIMVEAGAFDKVYELIKPEGFYVDSHQRIFRAMITLSQKSQPIDILTVVEQLRSTDEIEMVGGPYYISKLTNSVVSSANIESHTHIILEKFMKREMIRLGGELLCDAYEDSSDVFDLMDEFEKKYTELTLTRVSKKHIDLGSYLVARMQRIEALRQNPTHVTGIGAGFKDLDYITHGWQNTDLIILAARPAVGKTALALNFARNAAMHPTKAVPVAFFSLEMSAGQLTDRLLASESQIWLEKIMNGQMDEGNMKQLYTKGIQPLGNNAAMFIDDTPALNVYQLRSKSRALKRKHNIGLIVIDYLQLMSGSGERKSGNREQEISEISRNLKALAKELELPIIALSQLSREVEKRSGKDGVKTPQLSDLRESGAIEQDADLVMFMYRPEYYDVPGNELGESVKGETHITIAKNRNGKLAKGPEAIKLRADLAIQKFFDWDGQQTIPFVGTGGWRPVREEEKGGLEFGDSNLYIEPGSKINNDDDKDEGPF